MLRSDQRVYLGGRLGCIRNAVHHQSIPVDEMVVLGFRTLIYTIACTPHATDMALFLARVVLCGLLDGLLCVTCTSG